MWFLISLYDNSLVYYPNVFFTAIIFSFILASLYLIKLGRYLYAASREITVKVRRNRSRRIGFQPVGQQLLIAMRMVMTRIVSWMTYVSRRLDQGETYIQKISKKLKKELFIEK